MRDGRFISVPDFGKGLNIISCPSCSRVENESFVELAQQVRELTAYAAEHRITIAVMGCRVNGPGETDDADLGLWCGPSTVNLKRKDEKIGSFGYADVLPRLKAELDRLIAARAALIALALRPRAIDVEHGRLRNCMASERLPKMMIGFVVRRCTVELGRAPTPAEFAAWANASDDARRARSSAVRSPRRRPG